MFETVLTVGLVIMFWLFLFYSIFSMGNMFIGEGVLRDRVYTIPDNLVVKLDNIADGKGSRKIDYLGKLVVERDTKIRVNMSSFRILDGDFNDFKLNLKIYLSSEDALYIINAPCIYSTSECIRIQIVFPGYDVPMDIEKGVYNISVEVDWLAKGSGSVEFTLGFIEESKE